MNERAELLEGSQSVIDTVIVFRVLKLLTTSWKDQEAFKFGFIDDKGKRDKTKKPKTSEEKNAFTLLHRLIFNLKRVLELLPFGKTKLASYAAALVLLKEHFGVDSPYLEEQFYKFLKEKGLHTDLLEDYKPSHNTLSEGHTYDLRTSIWNDDDNVGYRGDKVTVLGLTDTIFGVNIYRVYNKNQDKSQVITGQDIK
jgi:hypothetical protein